MTHQPADTATAQPSDSASPNLYEKLGTPVAGDPAAVELVDRPGDRFWLYGSIG